MKFNFLILLSISSLSVFAQDNRPYELQRQKINSLLDARSAKFGQFESSLTKRTGIFGLKTKKDMQRSIDILSEIVQTDNNILRETKILLDYKDHEKSEVETKVDDSSQRLKAYMSTITTLQQRNTFLASEIKKMEDQERKYTIGVVALVLILVVMLVLRKRKI